MLNSIGEQIFHLETIHKRLVFQKKT